MKLSMYALAVAAVAGLAGWFTLGEGETPSALGERCGTAHRHTCAPGLVCVRHRCVYPCAATPGSDCAPEVAR